MVALLGAFVIVKEAKHKYCWNGMSNSSNVPGQKKMNEQIGATGWEGSKRHLLGFQRQVQFGCGVEGCQGERDSNAQSRI